MYLVELVLVEELVVLEAGGGRLLEVEGDAEEEGESQGTFHPGSRRRECKRKWKPTKGGRWRRGASPSSGLGRFVPRIVPCGAFIPGDCLPRRLPMTLASLQF